MIVGAICIRDNKILLAKRNIHPRKGLWTLPAGFMENAETLKVGALRETMEETMSEASVVMPYTMFSLPHINQVHLFYLADLLDDNFGPTSESIEVKLFSEDEIPWDEIAFPTVERTLKLYLEDVKTGDFIFRDEDINLW
jgi:ADP-ribose pyrophosphatase YjhB (NUDIX family)